MTRAEGAAVRVVMGVDFLGAEAGEPGFRGSQHPSLLGEAEHPHRLLEWRPFVAGCLARDLDVAALPFGEEVVHPLADEPSFRARAAGEVVALLLLEAVEQRVIAGREPRLLVELAGRRFQLGLPHLQPALRKLPDRSLGQRGAHQEVASRRAVAEDDDARRVVPLSLHRRPPHPVRDWFGCKLGRRVERGNRQSSCARRAADDHRRMRPPALSLGTASQTASGADAVTHACNVHR